MIPRAARRRTISERRPLWPALLAIPVALWPLTAAANTGVPMLVVVWPLSWLAFPIIVVLEAVVAKRVLALPTKDSFLLALSANAWSTLVGIPLTWAACVVVEMLAGFGFAATGLERSPIAEAIAAPFFAAWLPPFGGPGKAWWVFGAAAVLCVPFFFASVYVEAKVAARRVSKDSANRWARRANALTYGLAVLGFAAAALHSLSRSK